MPNMDEIEAELQRVEAGDVDAVEAWANDPKVCHGEIEKAALLSLCRRLREARKAYAELATAALKLSGRVHNAAAFVIRDLPGGEAECSPDEERRSQQLVQSKKERP